MATRRCRCTLGSTAGAGVAAHGLGARTLVVVDFWAARLADHRPAALGLTSRGAPAALLSSAAVVAGQHDGAGFCRRHHAEHGHNHTVKLGQFHNKASPSLGKFKTHESSMTH